MSLGHPDGWPAGWFAWVTDDADTYVQAAGMLAVRFVALGMGNSATTDLGYGGLVDAIVPLAPGGQLFIRCGTDAVATSGDDGPEACGSADIRQGGTGLNNRILVAAGAGSANFDPTSGPFIAGGDGGDFVSGDPGDGSFGGAGATASGGAGKGKGQAGFCPGGAGYFGGFTGGINSGGGGGVSYASPALFDASAIKGGADGTFVFTDGTTTRTLTAVGPDAFIAAYPIAAQAPNAPTLNAVGTIAYDRDNVFRWTFSTDQAWDSQSAFDLRYRVVDAASWTTISSVSSPQGRRTMASGTFVAGDYEWQVRTYEALGIAGPWSSSGFFTTVAAPDGPSITAPANDATLTLPDLTVEWTATAQDSWQIRVVADDDDTADPSTIYYDSGEVATAERSAPVNFPDNGVDRHIQLRIKVSGVWSDWDDADVLVHVNYSPPQTPMFSLMADDELGRLLVTISNPTPDEGQPDAVGNEVWVDDGFPLGHPDYGLTRRTTAAQVLPNTTWFYSTPVSSRDYGYESRLVVKAVGSNGSVAEADEPT